jgi:hypothetical protein
MGNQESVRTGRFEKAYMTSKTSPMMVLMAVMVERFVHARQARHCLKVLHIGVLIKRMGNQEKKRRREVRV